MKVKRLKLKNFRSHVDTTLEFDRINIVRGTNGSGKSSIQLAIEMALVGHCDVTDQGGRGADALLTVGGQWKSWAVQVETDNGYTVQKSSGNLILTCSDPPLQLGGAGAKAHMESEIGRSDVLSAVLNSNRFVDLAEKEQRALLAGALASEPVPVDPAISALLEPAIGIAGSVNALIGSSKEVDAAYTHFFSARTNAKRDLKNLGEIVAPEIPEGAPSLEHVSKQIDELIHARDGIVLVRAAKKGNYEGARRRVLEGISKLEALTLEKKTLEPLLLSDADLAKAQKRAGVKGKAAAIREGIAVLQSQIQEKRDAIAKMMEPQATECPTCGQPVAQEDRSGFIVEYSGVLKTLEAALENDNAALLKLGDVETAAETIAKHKAAMVRTLQIDNEIKALPAAQELLPPDVSNEDVQIEAIDQRLTKGRLVHQQVAALDGQRRQYEQVAAKAKKLQMQIAALDRLCEYFGDKGPLKSKLVGDKLPGFVRAINDGLHRFGFTCHFTLDPFVLNVHTFGGNPDGPTPYLLGLNQLSESERYRFGIAFQVALAQATGVNLVVIDRADMLSAGARKELTSMLMDSSLDQAIVLTTGEPTGQYPKVDGVRFFELVNTDGVTKVQAFG